MRCSIMAVDRNRQFISCRRFLVLQLESVQKLLEMGIPDEVYQECMRMFCNHVANLYVCGLIDEEFFRGILDDIIEDAAIECAVVVANDIRKDIVRIEDNQKI